MHEPGAAANGDAEAQGTDAAQDDKGKGKEVAADEANGDLQNSNTDGTHEGSPDDTQAAAARDRARG